MKDIQELSKIYHFNIVSIDRYARGWVQNALQKIGLIVHIRPSLAEIYVNLKSLMLGNKGNNLYLPDNPGIKRALLNTQAYFGRNNALSIAHERTDEGHSDEADAISTAVFSIRNEIIDDDNTIIHYSGPGLIWTEDKTKAKTFNFLHKVTPEEEKEEQEDISNLF